MKKELRIIHDRETDTLAVSFSDQPAMDNYELPGGVIANYGKRGELVGLEFLGKVSEQFAELIEHARGEGKNRPMWPFSLLTGTQRAGEYWTVAQSAISIGSSGPTTR